jgi:hypothetical protein
MKRAVVVVYLVFLALSAFAQTGNEWLMPGQPYFKIPVGKEGLYKLTYTQLTNAGLSAASNPTTFQLFHRGKEISIYVEGQGDGQFNPTDFIEFFGQRNDGKMDNELYVPSSGQPHQRQSLFTDTAYYFLTYGQAAGKRIPFLTTPDPVIPAESFHWDEKVKVLMENYSGGTDYNSSQIQKSVFEPGEGWTGNIILQGQTQSYLLEDVINTIPAAGVPKIEVLVTARGPMDHRAEIYAGSRLVGLVEFSAFESKLFAGDLEWSDISGDGKVTISVKVIGVGAVDRMSVGYIRLRYPQQTNIAGNASKKFVLRENAGGTSSVQLTNALPGTRIFDVTDVENVSRLSTTGSSTLNVFVPSTLSSRQLWATNSTLSTSVRKASFRSYTPGSYDFVIITHPDLRKPVSGYIDPVKAYAEYRSLPEGGSYDTLVANIDQLYDQFSYGDPSPLAIRHFLKYISTGKRPDYLFLIGKGLDIYYNYYRNPTAFVQNKNYVPTAGYPASDMLFSAGLSGKQHVAGISTGRLSAVGPTDVAAYFNKVKEFEARPFNDLRRKNLLHLSGGLLEGEPELFRQFLEEYAEVAEDRFLGGKVKAIAKQSTDIEVVNVAEEVNQGVALITLFGHSSPTSSDFDIGLVTDPVMGYNNIDGKYPAFLMNGCSAGSFFLNTTIFGENWTNTADRGAIAVIAHSFFGFAFTLRNYSRLFYETGFGDDAFINKGVGDIQREVSSRYLAELANPGPLDETQTQQMVLLGDPAVRLFGATKPDYAIVPESVSIQTKSGEPLTAFADSLILSFVVPNFGKAVSQNFTIRVTRSLSDNSTVHYDSTFQGILYSDSIHFFLPGNIPDGFGSNQFSITIDADQDVDELNESNNTYQKIFFIPLSGTKNLYPNDFAIVHDTQVNLTFQHTDQLSQERDFILEIDTALNFDSEFKQSFTIRKKVLAQKKFTLLTEDSVVYFWRTKLAEPNPNENPEWEVSSFVYIVNGPEGWAQVRFSQFNDNLVSGLVKDAAAKRIEYTETEIDIAVKTFEASQPETFSVKINDAEYNIQESNNFQCRDNTINLIAFNKTTTQPYLGVFFSYIEINNLFQGRRLYCGREPYIINSFTSSELVDGSEGDLFHYILNVAAGDSVILFTNGDAGFPSWPADAKSKLGELGISSTQIEALAAGEPAIILARKGTPPGSAKVIGSSTDTPTYTEFSGTVTGRNSNGIMTSGLIGPAASWGELLIRYSDKEESDEITFDIFGVDLGGNQTLLLENLDSNHDLSQLDATDYPFIKVRFKSSDETFVTSAQLDRWIVTFEPVAEGLLLYNGDLDQQVLAEGQSLDREYSFINISDRAFTDSLVVKFDVINAATNKATTGETLIDAPAPNDTTIFTIQFQTLGHEGSNSLDVNVNPKILPENTYDNNVIGLADHLVVLADSIPPVLSVTFDGRELARDEFVSNTPLIDIKVWDNNSFLLKKDTTGMLLFLKPPCEDNCAFERIYFASPLVTWFAETDTTEFHIEYSPFLAEAGKYTLHVEGQDASGNPSGPEPFEITFQVGIESVVQFMPPYPNPFNLQANFEFVIAGSTIPDHASLQLVNLSGKIMKEFSLPVDNLHIGNNRVQWIGLDQYGNPVPNGVYIFKFNVTISQQTFTQIGKIVLVR